MWGFEKNVAARDMKIIVALVEKRKREEGKETRVYFKDRLVEPKKMERFKKRKLAMHDAEQDTLSAGKQIGRWHPLPMLMIPAFRKHVRCETPVSESEEVGRPSQEPTFAIGPVDLECLGSAILNEYNGNIKLTASWNECRSAGLAHVEDLFRKASEQEKHGDLENAEKALLQVLDAPNSQKDIGTIFDALRGILRIRTIGSEYVPALSELERLVAGCLCVFGPAHNTYLALGVELTICYYKADRYDEGNALTKHILSIYKENAGPLPEESCSRLLYWASGRIVGLSKIPDFKLLYSRLLRQYEEGGKLRSAILLAMDVVDGLQFSNDFKEADYYFLSACACYEKIGPEAGAEHIQMLTGLVMIQCSNRSNSYIDESLLDKFRRDALSLLPLRVMSLTRIALSYTALQLHAKAHQLYSHLDLEDKALRGGRFSRENWKVVIAGLGDEACNLAALGELEPAERLFILAEELALREMGRTHWRSKAAVKNLKMFQQRDPDLWAGRFEALSGARAIAVPSAAAIPELRDLYEEAVLAVHP